MQFTSNKFTMYGFPYVSKQIKFKIIIGIFINIFYSTKIITRIYAQNIYDCIFCAY
jgi:hypothetical protein